MGCGCKQNKQTEPVQQVPLTITVNESQPANPPVQPQPTQQTTDSNNNPS
jgi:hypothetical protein